MAADGGATDGVFSQPTQMIDVGGKEVTFRTAMASGVIHLAPSIIEAVREGRVPKGNVLEVARVAGIMAAKRTSENIPLCHPIPLEMIKVLIETGTDSISVRAEIHTHAKTGVEMEALSAVSAACLTIYDMCKSFPEGRSLVIERIFLVEKSGGVRGNFSRTGPKDQEIV